MERSNHMSDNSFFLHRTRTLTAITPRLPWMVANSSKSIQINPSDTSASIDNNTNRINLGISNIRLSDELGTYKINSIKTEEYKNGKWEPDTENFLRPEFAKQLDVVLVLDVSNSLGGDVQDVKNYASEFVDFLFSENPNSRIGIVGFSENISITLHIPKCREIIH